MPKILVFSSSLVTLNVSVHNFFETRLLLKISDAEFPYKLSYVEPLCLLAKIAAKTVKRRVFTQPLWLPWVPQLVGGSAR